MDITGAGSLWLIAALLLALAELLTGTLVLLALAVAVLITALAAALGLSLAGQLWTLGLASAVCVPLMIKVIRPWFSPAGVKYGVAGTGAQKGERFCVVRRERDGACGIKIKGDFFRARYVAQYPEPHGEAAHGACPAAGSVPAEGSTVVLDHFDGTLVRVLPAGGVTEAASAPTHFQGTSPSATPDKGVE